MRNAKPAPVPEAGNVQPHRLLADKIFPMGRKHIYQHTRLQAHTAMNNTGRHIIPIPFPDDALFVANGHFKHATVNIRYLRMRVLVQGAYATGFEPGLHQHHPVVVTIYLPLNAIANIFPWNILLKLKCGALYHVCTLIFAKVKRNQFNNSSSTIKTARTVIFNNKKAHA
jgi:hypothetical protein